MAFCHTALAAISSLEDPFPVRCRLFLEGLMMRSTSPGAKINEFLDCFCILLVGLKM
jgi:hypothetical protein